MAVLQAYQTDLLKDLDKAIKSRSEPEQPGVLARPGLRIGDGHRRLVSRLVPLPHLRVGVEGGTGQREVGKT